MKMSNFDRLMHQYISSKTTIAETIKIESMLKARKHEPISMLSAETEELLCQKIKEPNAGIEEVTQIMTNLVKLRVAEIKWREFGGGYVYFAKELY